jgi:hypothetical protein
MRFIEVLAVEVGGDKMEDASRTKWRMPPEEL